MFGRGSKSKVPSGVNVNHSSFGMKDGGYNPNFGAMKIFEEGKKDKPKVERQRGRPGGGWDDSDEEDNHKPTLNPGSSGFGGARQTQTQTHKPATTTPATTQATRNPYTDPRYKPTVTSTTAISKSRNAADHDSAGEYETKLVEDICQPGGARIKPPDSVLTEFCTKCKSLKTVVIGKLLLDQVNKSNAIIQQKALYTVEALMKQLGGYKQYFQDNESRLSQIPNMTNSSVSNQLSVVKAVIHGTDPRAHKFEKVEAVRESYGTVATASAGNTNTNTNTESVDLLGAGEEVNTNSGGLLGPDSNSNSSQDVLGLGTDSGSSANKGNAFGFMNSESSNTSSNTTGQANAFGFVDADKKETTSAFGFVDSTSSSNTTTAATAVTSSETKGNAFGFMAEGSNPATTDNTQKGNAFGFMSSGDASTKGANDSGNATNVASTKAEEKMTTSLFENLTVAEKGKKNKSEADPFAELGSMAPENDSSRGNSATNGASAFGFVGGSNGSSNHAHASAGSNKSNAFGFVNSGGAGSTGPSASDLQNQIKMSYGGNPMGGQMGGHMGGNQMAGMQMNMGMNMGMMDPNQLQMQIQYLQKMQQMQHMHMSGGGMGNMGNMGMGMGAGANNQANTGMAFNLAPMSGQGDYQPALGKQKSEEKKPDEFDFVNSMMKP